MAAAIYSAYRYRLGARAKGRDVGKRQTSMDRVEDKKESRDNQKIATPSGKSRDTENFPVGSFLIRADLRRHVHAFYRFARMADDIADNPNLAPAEKIRRLDVIEAALLGKSNASLDIAIAMRRSLEETGISSRHCIDLLIAFRQDADKKRYKDWNDLLNYCRYSASPVGRYLLDLHGEDEKAWLASDALCMALQILNHLQDCADDYREMDRVYIPLDHLEVEALDVPILSKPAASPALRRVLDRILQETDNLIEQSRHLPSALHDWRLRAESAAIIRIAQRLSHRLKDFDPLAERVKLTSFAYAASMAEGLWRSLSPFSSQRPAT